MSTVWEALNVSLPELRYENVTTSGQGKGSTTWAAHSHTPTAVAEWEDFDNLVATEGMHARNHRQVEENLSLLFKSYLRFMEPCSTEEHISKVTSGVLNAMKVSDFDLSDGVSFPERNTELTAKPDIIAMKNDDKGLGVGPSSAYVSPPKGTRAKVRRDTVQLIRSLYRFPFETKPNWKFEFLAENDAEGETSRSEAHCVIIDSWSIPGDFDSAKMQAEVPLPRSWPLKKKKVFHLVRQLYGQMVADHCRYGVFHTYDLWIFCKRSTDGTLFLSRAFRRKGTSPSVCQAIKTLIGFRDYRFSAPPAMHPSSASKMPQNKKPRKSYKPPPKPPLPPSNRDDGFDGKPRGKRGGSKAKDGDNLAATLSSWEMNVYDRTEKVLLLTTPKYPSVLVKMQQKPTLLHVSREMKHEADFYATMQDISELEDVIPKYYGYSTHLGVALTCVERESDNFDDICVENLPEALKHSAVQAVEALSRVGVLHNDLELHNIVQSRNDPMKAKIIDFGRAEFSSDRNCLNDQVEHVKFLLGLGQNQHKSEAQLHEEIDMV